MDYAVTLEGISKYYGKHKAADQVSLHIKKGEIYGFIGRNGAGKTTCMKLICGLAKPTAGQIMLFGHKGADIKPYYSRIGSLLEAPGIYPNMTAYQNMKVKCLALGIHKDGYIEDILKLVGLDQTGNKKVKQFSLGMRQRLGIGLALVGDPDLLILDEPINGLDPQGIAEVRETILRLNKEINMTIMVSSHILEELSKIADRYGIIDQGHMIEELSNEELQDRCSSYILVQTSTPEQSVTVLESMGIHNYKVVDKVSVRIYERLEEKAAINQQLILSGCDVSSISVVSDEIESYFINLTGGANNA